MEADRAGVEPRDLEQVLDEALEPDDVARQEVERRLRPFGELVAAGLHHLDRGRQRHQRRSEFVADVGGEPGVALDALLQRLGHVVERLGEDSEVGVVGGLEAGVEAAAGDRRGRLRGGADGTDRTAGGEDAEEDAEAGRDRCGEDQRQPNARQGRVGLVEAERFEVGADAGDVPADDDVQLVAEADDLAGRGALVDRPWSPTVGGTSASWKVAPPPLQVSAYQIR